MRPTSLVSNPSFSMESDQPLSTTAESASCIKQRKKQNLKRRPDVSHFDKLPDAALIAIAALAAIMGKGVSTAWRDIRNDPDFPKPIRLSAGCTRFRVGDIRQYLAGKADASAKPKRTQRMKGKVAL